MKLSLENLKDLCDIACEAALKAGAIINEARVQPIEVLNKDAGDTLASQVVTETDHRCDEVIRKTLLPASKAFDLALLTEEVEDDGERLIKDYFWCVDPLDGTLAFTRGQAGFAVSIALVAQDSTPMIGVVYDPLEDKLYSAIRDGGAVCNGQSWEAPSKSAEYLTVPIDNGLQKRKDFLSIMQALENYTKANGMQGLHLLHHAGAVMSAIWVAESPLGCYFKLPKPLAGGGSSWDFAATACIYNELGMSATDFYGAPLKLNRAESTYMNVDGSIMATNNQFVNLLELLFQR